MNREQKRKLKRLQRKGNDGQLKAGNKLAIARLMNQYTPEELAARIAVQRMRNGNFDLSDLKLPPNFMHIDNEVLAPEGIKCKLNAQGILARPQEQMQPAYIQWVKDNADKELHLTREGASRSMVCIRENQGAIAGTDAEGNPIPHMQYLFDLSLDLLIWDESVQDYRFISDIKSEIEEEVHPLTMEEQQEERQIIDDFLSDNKEKEQPKKMKMKKQEKSKNETRK